MKRERITTMRRLREIVGEPSHRVTGKEIDHIDGICERFIAASSYLLVGSRGADGRMDVSPRGDPAGFVQVLDPKTLAIPDRPGNKRIDTFENLLTDPEVGLLFLIPGYALTLRVSGTASIVRDPDLQSSMAVNGREPHLVMLATVSKAFMHCAKSIARGGMWTPDQWSDTSDVPSLAEAMVAHAELSESTSRMQAIIDDDFEERMY
ncbi:MSMEG_1061 family FMN-dependent PPOX-type flavoprotein [Jannaschia aquimarina]|uniref:Pyridoxamine 5'-phosphate oxidase n=1 Tax=Jannaschia aquimarina TaxID=935700 RepID=A0A0D1EM90_9RHOB|nr:MSMEG_1061 family FMN-dependent PPOX-type flavoprotein [Jannaschia aquimarina]KIT18101.1 Pyridoxamine 5'-phosphate oxidase [Jannaschia aquimarina]SNT40845.1 hypothetical protein SAMN05421775_11618 [Jannaschia aquimarina]